MFIKVVSTILISSLYLNLHRALTAATSTRFKRYYFGTLKICTSRVTLSMFTASELPPKLKAVKSAMAIPLVKFEEAKVELGEAYNPRNQPELSDSLNFKRGPL